MGFLSSSTWTQLQDKFPQLTSSNIFLSLFYLALVVLFMDYGYMIYLHFKMPPGPFPLPIIGNTHLLPLTKPWIYFEELATRVKSPIITFWIGRNPTVWINDAETARELLERRAAIYCSRPRMVVFGELGPGQTNLVSMYYTPRWRTHRKLTHMGVGTQQTKTYYPFQNDESRVVALDLLDDPNDYARILERWASSVVGIVGFGRRVKDVGDPKTTEVLRVMQRAAELNVPGREFPMLMETFPFLAKFPTWMAPWKHGLGRKNSRGTLFYYNLYLESLSRPLPPPYASSTSSFLPYSHKLSQEIPHYQPPLSPREIAALTGNLFGAGSDTSSSTLITFVLACCAFPDFLERAWEEMDRVVGWERSPGLEDREDLRYLGYLVKEIFRWRSVAIIGGQPHSNIKEDWYKGYLIPKNSWVQGNIWAIHRNPIDFPDPDRFCPERFEKGHELYREPINERGYMTFGWGRRVCSGQGLAEQGTWLSVARLIWGFKIKKLEGEEVDIFDYTSGLNMRPNPFKCSITPRNSQIEETIRREGKEALERLSIYDEPDNETK